MGSGPAWHTMLWLLSIARADTSMSSVCTPVEKVKPRSTAVRHRALEPPKKAEAERASITGK